MRITPVTILLFTLAAAAAASSVAAGSQPFRTRNITKILAEHPEFSTFNNYLTLTNLAPEINRRTTITVLAVDNAAMSALIARGFSINTLNHVLSLLVLVDYFDPKKLHELTGGSALSSTLFQASGYAPGSSGFVNITDRGAGAVTFAPYVSPSSTVHFVKSVKEIPYIISVLQISDILLSPFSDAPAPSPGELNLTDIMSKKGCGTFAGLLASNNATEEAFVENSQSGLTVFCPTDDAMQAFLPKFENLTADGKVSLLEYHAVPLYESIQMLKSENGAVLKTLATDGAAKNYTLAVRADGDVVKLRTRVVTATITGTLVDDDPDAVYTIDTVLEPPELFKAAAAGEGPAPAPAPAAEAPKGGGKKKAHGGKGSGGRHSPPPASASPDGSPDAAPADENDVADQNGSGRAEVAALLVVALTAIVAVHCLFSC